MRWRQYDKYVGISFSVGKTGKFLFFSTNAFKNKKFYVTNYHLNDVRRSDNVVLTFFGVLLKKYTSGQHVVHALQV